MDSTVFTVVRLVLECTYDGAAIAWKLGSGITEWKSGQFMPGYAGDVNGLFVLEEWLGIVTNYASICSPINQ